MSEATPTHVLALRQPWAWLMTEGPKDIENRKLRWKFRGPVFVMASGTMTRREYAEVKAFALERGVTIPPASELKLGGIVGQFTITDCVTEHPSEWFFGPYGYICTDRKPLPFVPLKGRLGIFKLEGATDAG